jgi:hypothetical protein
MSCGSTVITLLELEKQQEDGTVRPCGGEKTPEAERIWHILHTILIHKEGTELRPSLEFCAEGTQDVSLWYLNTEIVGHARMVDMSHVILRRTMLLELSLQKVEDNAVRAIIAEGSLAFKGWVAVLTIDHQMYAIYSMVITGS